MRPVQIITEDAAQPKGPYSQGMKMRGTFVFTAGQGPVDPVTQEFIGGTFEAQARRTLENVVAVLAAGGARTSDVVKVMVVLRDFGDFEEFNCIYRDFFSVPFPSRTTFEAPLPNFDIEIDAIAILAEEP